MAISISSPKGQASGAKTQELTVISKVIKGDTYLVMADSARELDDEFSDLYLSAGKTTNLALAPPYNPRQLKNAVTHNNVLLQCVHAMEVNIDGTGHEFVPAEKDGKIDPAELQAATDFFSEPYPGRSFVSQRRAARNDAEALGYGYIEVLRSLDDTVVATRHLEAQQLRLVKLGLPVQLKHTVQRGGKPVILTLTERPRRYMQLIGGVSRRYYKEFGCPLDLNSLTGEWADPDTRLKAEERASEILCVSVGKDNTTPYFVPRWINQMPSVVGSRKAEEANLEFFDSGGMPPAIIFVQGGSMVGESANQLRTYLSAANKKKGRAVVVELASNTGALDSSGGSVSVKVERFGAERAHDSMYMAYDKNAEDHVRVGFRLPPLFLGKASDYNYATAVVAYQVAEAQVFGPERLEFDEMINKTLIKALGFKSLKFKSLPINMKSVEETFAGLKLIDGKVVGSEFVAEVNKVIGTSLKYQKPEPVVPPGAAAPGAPATGQKGGLDQSVGPTPPLSVAKKAEDRLELLHLVRKSAIMEGFVPDQFLTPEDTAMAQTRIDGLGEDDRARFISLLAQYVSQPIEHSH